MNQAQRAGRRDGECLLDWDWIGSDSSISPRVDVMDDALQDLHQLEPSSSQSGLAGTESLRDVGDSFTVRGTRIGRSVKPDRACTSDLISSVYFFVCDFSLLGFSRCV